MTLPHYVQCQVDGLFEKSLTERKVSFVAIFGEQKVSLVAMDILVAKGSNQKNSSAVMDSKPEMSSAAINANQEVPLVAARMENLCLTPENPTTFSMFTVSNVPTHVNITKNNLESIKRIRICTELFLGLLDDSPSIVYTSKAVRHH